MKLKTTIACTILILVSAVAALAQDRKPTAIENYLVEVEKGRFAAMVSCDIAKLEKVLADDLVYTHSTARTDTKKDILQALSSKATEYKAIDPEAINARVFGETAVLNGTMKVQVKNNGNEQTFRVRYLNVYAKRAGRWQLIAWQSTRVPE
jgi:ketosteroid isomerase-like protein